MFDQKHHSSNSSHYQFDQRHPINSKGLPSVSQILDGENGENSDTDDDDEELEINEMAAESLKNRKSAKRKVEANNSDDDF